MQHVLCLPCLNEGCSVLEANEQLFADFVSQTSTNFTYRAKPLDSELLYVIPNGLQRTGCIKMICGEVCQAWYVPLRHLGVNTNRSTTVIQFT